MEDWLQTWKLREWLTIDEATYLALGCDPSNRSYNPDGWEGFNSSLLEAVTLGIETEFLNEEAIVELLQHGFLEKEPQEFVDQHLKSTDDLIFKTGMVRGNLGATVKGCKVIDTTHGLEAANIDNAQIKIEAIKKWLLSKNLKPEFFFPENNTDLSKGFVEASSTEEKQKYAKKKTSSLLKEDWLSHDEITALVCNRDPKAFYTDNVDAAMAMKEQGVMSYVGVPDDGYDDLYTLMAGAVERKEIKVNGSGKLWLEDVKKWLTSENLKLGSLSLEEAREQTKKEAAEPKYQTRLMKIMYETIDRYYGATYDPDDADSFSKQTDVIAWLERTHGLSGAEAKAIDKMTRPERQKP